MTVTQKALYGSNNQAITITLASLGSGSARASTAIDNTTNLFLDALVTVKVKTAGTVAAPFMFDVYAYGTVDGGTTYSDGATGSDAAITLTSPPNVRKIGTVNTPVTATSYVAGPFSVADAFGGKLPDHWGIIIKNNSGATADSTGGNFAVVYQGIQAQQV